MERKLILQSRKDLVRRTKETMEEKKMTKAEVIASYLVQNWHYCPIDDEVNIPECEGWRVCKKCVKCILKHSDAIIINDDVWEE